MPTIQEVFADSLVTDPAAALAPIQIPVRKRSGPMPHLQYVIEFVGPRSLSAAAAASLLSPQWQDALGHPACYCMSVADVEWRPLGQGMAGSYDSLALAWDMFSPEGQLTTPSAHHLLATADRFAEQIQRKAMPMPIPEDVPKAISQIQQIKTNFDAGASLLVLAKSRQVSEYELWVWCAHLGLLPNLAEGTFDWVVPGSDLPLFSVSPLGDTESFGLEAAARGDQHEGVLLGFSIPRSPEPLGGLQGMFQAAHFLAGKIWGEVFDEDGKPATASTRQTMQSQLSAAVQALQKAGFPPGSPESLRLFPG